MITKLAKTTHYILLLLGAISLIGRADSPTVALANQSSASSVSANPYGITPDDPASVQRGIEAAYRAHATKVTVPPGIYRLSPLDNSTWHLQFSRMKDFEIDASGVTFVFLGRDKRAMHFVNCDGVTFRGATLLRETPPFSQGKIVAVAEDRQSVDIRIDKGYPTDVDDIKQFKFSVINIYQPGTQKLKPLVPDLYLSGIDRLGPDMFRFRFRAPVNPAIPLAIGDCAAWRALSGGDLAFWDCSGMLCQDITIENGTGLGIVELCGEGDNHYLHCVITYAPPPPGAVDPPLLACGADGFDSVAVRHGPTLENCLFEGLDDDCVNIRGTYAMLMEAKGRTIVVDWRSPHQNTRGELPIARPGDTLRLYNRKGALSDEATVTSVKPSVGYVPPDFGRNIPRVFWNRLRASYWEVTLDKDVTGDPGGMVANPNQIGDGFHFRNCTFRNGRAHGLLIRSGNGIIEGCTVEGILKAGIVVAPDLNDWNEADYSRNLVIQGNTIRRVGLGTEPWNSGVTVAAPAFGGFVPLPGGHRNIVIRDNIFEDNPGPNLVVTSAIGVKIENNQFIRPMEDPAFHIVPVGIDNTSALIWMRSADQVSMTGNIVKSPGSYLKSLIDVDASVTAEGLDHGVAIQK